MQSYRSWWFHEVYEPPETCSGISCRESLSQRKNPCRCVVVEPVGFGNNFLFSWIAFTLFWDNIPTLYTVFFLRWWAQILKTLLGKLIRELLPTFQRTIEDVEYTVGPEMKWGRWTGPRRAVGANSFGLCCPQPPTSSATIYLFLL